MTTVWIVVRYWPSGMRENAAAFFSEANAREAAGKMVGQHKDGMIMLEPVNVQDEFGESVETSNSATVNPDGTTIS